MKEETSEKDIEKTEETSEELPTGKQIIAFLLPIIMTVGVYIYGLKITRGYVAQYGVTAQAVLFNGVVLIGGILIITIMWFHRSFFERWAERDFIVVFLASSLLVGVIMGLPMCAMFNHWTQGFKHTSLDKVNYVVSADNANGKVYRIGYVKGFFGPTHICVSSGNNQEITIVNKDTDETTMDIETNGFGYQKITLNLGNDIKIQEVELNTIYGNYY